MRRLSIAAALTVFAAGLAVAWQWRPASAPAWRSDEIALMQSLWIQNLPPLPPDRSNAVADHPRAARFGQTLFFDPGLSATGTIACATCHQPERNFTDGRQKAQAIGTTRRNTPSVVGSAYSPWLYWDGRRDSQWAQALTPLEDKAEHGGNRMQLVRYVAGREVYRREYEALFGALPRFDDRQRFPDAATPLGSAAEVRAWSGMQADDRETVNQAFANIGKALAAYERKLVPGASRFDAYVEAVADGDEARQRSLFSGDEAQGLRLFLGKARCLECHNGPLFTNNEFHNTGVIVFPGDLPDTGRAEGLRAVRRDPFNCLGAYNDDPDPYCGELRFARDTIELIGAMRTPSLRNLGGTAPYMHRGQLEDLDEVLRHYNEAPLAMIGHNEAEPLSLSRREVRQLKAFLLTLDSPVYDGERWLREPPGVATSKSDEKRSHDTR